MKNDEKNLKMKKNEKIIFIKFILFLYYDKD